MLPNKGEIEGKNSEEKKSGNTVITYVRTQGVGIYLHRNTIARNEPKVTFAAANVPKALVIPLRAMELLALMFTDNTREFITKFDRSI